MSKIDFSKYPKILELILDTSIEDIKDDIQWIRTSNSETAVLIAEMHQMCKAGLSSNIPLRKRSKNSSNFYHGAVGDSLHVFAKEQGRVDLGLTKDEVKNLFKHKSFLGGIHSQSYVDVPVDE
ncbi:hypothetical protein [Oceanobacillus salinisoli]|uniref:hypothetical protein n=1 Tax=Oceanobacillus salinisoli TaxID=2678611 RepID=UPI0012E29E27|nr:hypothetical protein [Oceanobacillus salinisoli]